MARKSGIGSGVLVAAIVGVIAAAGAGQSLGAGFGSPLPQLVERVQTGVVEIRTANGQGSGFLVADDLVATVEHVVAKATRVTVTRDSGVVGAAVVIGSDTSRDIALLQLCKPTTGYHFRLADRDPILGEDVAVLGFPLDLPLTVTKGAISGTDRSVHIAGSMRTRLMQTDAAANSGNSGGPLVSLDDGTVLGLVDLGTTEANGIAFAVSSRVASALFTAWKLTAETHPAGCPTGALPGTRSPATPPLPAEAIAQVGTVTITRSSFVALINQARRSYASQKRTFPKTGSPGYIALQNQAVQFLVQRAEFDEEAKALGVRISDKRIAQRLATIKQQYFGGDEKKYQKQLKDQGLTDDQVRNDIRAQIISEELFKKVRGDAKVTDADVAAYYKKNPGSYTKAESRDVRHILVKTKAQADSIEAQLKAGADFARLAKTYSLDPGSKDLGGKLTISRGQTVAPFDKAAFSLKTNEISSPVKTQYGYHVIQALSPVKPKTTRPLSQVRETIRTQLLQQRRSKAMTKWVATVRKKFKKKIVYAPGFAPPAGTKAPKATSR